MGQFPVFIGLRRSFSFSCLLVAAHGAAIASALLLPLYPWVQVLLALLIACSLWHSLRERGSEIAGLTLSVNEGLSCLKKDGTRVSATVLPESAVFVWLVVLRFRMDGEARIRSLALFPDHMSGDEFRLLRLWLRWNSNATEELS